MFTDDRNFWPVIRFTLLYSIINVPLGLVGALLTATLLNQNVRGLGVVAHDLLPARRAARRGDRPALALDVHPGRAPQLLLRSPS